MNIIKFVYNYKLQKMKTLKIIKLLVVVSIFASCSSVFSGFGNKTTTISTKCDNCKSNENYYRGYGKIQVNNSVGAENDAPSEARDRARREIVKFIEVEAMGISNLFNKRDPSGNSASAFEQSYTQTFFNKLYNQEEKCTESKLVKRKRNSPEKIIVTSCIEIDRKNFNDTFYKDQYEMFSSAKINSETFQMQLKANLRKKQ